MDDLVALRERVLLNSVRVTAVAVPFIAAVLIAMLSLQGRLNSLALVLSLYTLLFPLLWAVFDRLGAVTRSTLHLLLLLGAALIVELRGGIGAAASAIQLTVLVIAGVVFGRRGIAWTFAATFATLGLAAFAVTSGLVASINLPMWDPTEPGVWIRSALILSLFGGGAAISVSDLLSKIQESTQQLRDSLTRERAEHAARVKAEAAQAEARDALEEAQRLEVIGRLAGGIAHDYNNALTVILAAAEVVRAEPSLSTDARACVEDISQTALRSAELTRSLLTLGRREVSKPALIEVSPFIRQLARRLRRTIPRSIQLSVAPDSEGHVRADPRQLERALTNLILNARDAVQPEGQIEISSRLIQLDDDERGLPTGTYVELQIRDSGHGMTPETRQRIFEPFFSTKPLEQGSGLGMTVVKAFAEEVQGRLEISSRPDQGTTITLLIPHSPGRIESPREARAERVLRPEPAWIVVVDGDSQVLAAMTRALQSRGFQVRPAMSFEQALALIEDQRVLIDLLCVDSTTLDPHASELLERSRALRPELRVLICSGYVEGDRLRALIRAGQLAYLAKPFTSAQLVEQVTDLLDKH